jgi:hypothetical protein
MLTNSFLRRLRRGGSALSAVVLLGTLYVGAGRADVNVVGSDYDTPSGTGTIGPAAPAGAITRAQIVARARDWLEHKVPYGETEGWQDAAVGGPYRIDCSGFVSMAWALGSSLITSTLPQAGTVVATSISGDTKIAPGDALDYTADHVVLFDHWTDAAGGFVYDSEHTFGYGASQTAGNIDDSTLEGFAMSDFEALQYDNLSGG